MDDFTLPKRSSAPLFVALAVIGAVVLGCGLFVLRSFASARADLEADGYTSPKVKMKGPFTFTFSGAKGTQSCSGTITRYPGSSSRQEMCFDNTPTVPPPPPLSNRQQLEKSLERNDKYAKIGFDHFTCPEIVNADTKATCTATAPNGASVGILVERTKVDTDGSWAEWTMVPQTTVHQGEAMSADLTKSVSEKAKHQHPKGVDVDCGTGPAVFVGGTFTCTVTTRDAKPKKGKIVLTDKDGSAYSWTTQL